MTTFPKDFTTLTQQSTDPHVQQSIELVTSLMRIVDKIPMTYPWRVMDSNIFNEGLKRSSTVLEANRLYWMDMSKAMEAYSVMSMWRAAELIESISYHAEKRSYNSMAVLARSLIELAAYYRHVASFVKGTLSTLPDTFSDTLIASEGLEQIVYRAIHGTFLPTTDEAANKKNNRKDGSAIDTLAKRKDCTRLKEIYAHLCEVTHPNVLGNARFWQSKNAQSDGSQLVAMHRFNSTPVVTEISEHTLWALGWSSYSIRSSFVCIRDSITLLLDFLATPNAADRR